MAKPELGAKRQCQSCGTKFYDLKQDPIVCPKCGAIFQVGADPCAGARAAGGRRRTEKEGVETVSLDEVEEKETAAESIDVDEDVEIDQTMPKTTPSSKKKRARTTMSPD